MDRPSNDAATDSKQDERLALEPGILLLSPEQREIVHLHVFDGLTFREIAEASGTSPNTVAAGYRYSLAKLRVLVTCEKLTMRDRVDVEKVLRRYRPAAPRPAPWARIASTANIRAAATQPHREARVMKHHTITGGGGVHLHVVETGNPSGRPILFIHGFSQCWLAWRRQLNSDLADRYRLVAMDMRGHGLSEKPRDGYADSRLWADDVDAVLQALTLDHPVLCGWSYGPLVILDYVRHYGEEAVGGMTFVGGITKLGSEEAASVLNPEFLNLVPGFFSADVEESTRSLRSLLLMSFTQEPKVEDLYLMLGYNVSVPPHVRQALFSRSFDNDDLLPRLRNPLLIVHGDRDAIVKPAIVDQHTARLPHAEVALIPNAGHAVFWDDAAAFNRRLQTFCERLELQAVS
jgi:pimeloyl-ACP methyl ester carboxylesterase